MASMTSNDALNTDGYRARTTYGTRSHRVRHGLLLGAAERPNRREITRCARETTVAFLQLHCDV
jgi:hypothetical protein